MDTGSNRRDEADLGAQIAGAFAWWRGAGVDGDLHDTPQNWLADDAPQAAAPPAPVVARSDRAEPAPPQGMANGPLPEDLAAFADWWLAEPALDGGRVADRVAPRGSAGARLMVLVPHPEREDTERLLSGPQGALLEAMLGAMGLSPDEAYVAAALPRHTPHADWPEIAGRGMGAILSRHVALARPERLIVFGGNILPLLSNDPAKKPDDLEQFNHESGSVPLLVGRDLAMLLERPGWKAGFWTRWLDWAK